MTKLAVLAAGNTIYVFADAAAAVQYTVLVGANVDVDTYRLPPRGGPMQRPLWPPRVHACRFWNSSFRRQHHD